jgi:checkpoint serine/threonine-protein kinase
VLIVSRKKKADEVFKLGVARRAQPLEKLKARHAAFLDRIMAINGVIPEDEPVHTNASNSARTPGRAILGQSAVAGPSSIAGATTTQQLAPSLRVPAKNNGSRMAIFADGHGEGEAGEAGAPSEWADFGTRDGRRKENVVEATPWKGETMPQSAAKLRVAPRTPKIEVFKEVVGLPHIIHLAEVLI